MNRTLASPLVLAAALLATPALAQDHGGHGHHAPPAAAAGIAEGKLEKGVRTFELAVTEEGFVPSRLKVEKGETVRLVVTRKTNTTCATEVVVKDRGINAPLPLDKPVKVEFKAEKSGEIAFACAMGHVGGVVFVK